MGPARASSARSFAEPRIDPSTELRFKVMTSSHALRLFNVGARNAEVSSCHPAGRGHDLASERARFFPQLLLKAERCAPGSKILIDRIE